MAQTYCRELQLDLPDLTLIGKPQRKAQLKNAHLTKTMNKLKRKNLHRQYNLLDDAHIDKTASLKWLTSPSLKHATEATICAIQEQAIFTANYIRRHIFKMEISDQYSVCRMEKETETIHHVISGCIALAPMKYLQRHDNVCKYIHTLLLLDRVIINNKVRWYDHQPRAVEENESTKILWNFSFQTDHTIPTISPTLSLLTNERATIIDVAIPNDHNLSQKRLADYVRILTSLWKSSHFGTLRRWL